MKIRKGFVSNSSSSSFVIMKNNITEVQIALIKEHFTIYPTLGITFDYEMDMYDKWSIDESEDTIGGWTSMDNFCMGEFLEKIGVNKDDIDWSS